MTLKPVVLSTLTKGSRFFFSPAHYPDRPCWVTGDPTDWGGIPWDCLHTDKSPMTDAVCAVGHLCVYVK